MAKLRDHNTGPYPILFRTNMEAGHGGKSGASSYRELSESYAFVLQQLGIAQPKGAGRCRAPRTVILRP